MTDIPLPSPGDTSWDDWAAEQETLTDASRAHIAAADSLPPIFRPEDYGAVGDNATDDTAAVQAAYSAAKIVGGKRGGTVLLSKIYAVSAPIKFYVAVSTVGHGWSVDTTFYNGTGLRALPGFTGSAILKFDPDGTTDYWWHWGTIEKIIIEGNGMSGPHGIDAGLAGEVSSIRNVQVYNCNAGIYCAYDDGATSLVVDTVSLFYCNYGLYAKGKVQVLSISGDHNNSLMYVTGGRGTNVNVLGLKAEAFAAAATGRHNPVIDVVDLDGGRVAIHGGWADTDEAKPNGFLRIRNPGGTGNRPRVIILGVDASDNYAAILNDTIAGETVANTVGVSKAPSIFWNGSLVVGGQATFHDGGPQVKTSQFISGTSYTFTLMDRFRATVLYSNAGAGTFTIPPNSSVPYPIGATLRVTQYDAGACTVTAGSGVYMPGGNKTTGGTGRSLTFVQTAIDQWSVIS